MTDAGKANGGPGGLTKLPTHIRNFDDILRGGLPKGRTTVINGGPGTGKTVLAMECLCRNAMAGMGGLFLSFEEDPQRLRDNFASFGWPIPDLEARGMLTLLHSDLPYLAITAGEMDVQGMLALLSYHADNGVEMIVIDAVDVLLQVFPKPYDALQALQQLLHWLVKRGLTVLITSKADNRGKQHNIVLDYLVDCVIYLDQRIDTQMRTRRLRVVKYRGSGFLSNEYPYVISAEGIALIPINAVAVVDVPKEQRIGSGVDGLDEALGGGLWKGAGLLVSGPTGSGKSTLGCCFAAGRAHAGEKVFHVSFEEAPQAMISWTHGIGIDLAAPIRAGTLQMIALAPELQGPDAHLLAIVNQIERWQPEHFVLDPISALLRMGSPDAAFDFVVRLLGVCRSRGITCLFTKDAASDVLTPRFTGRGISSLVDAIVSIRYQEVGQHIRREVCVVKHRGSDHSHTWHEMTISHEGVTVGAEPSADVPSQSGRQDP